MNALRGGVCLLALSISGCAETPAPPTAQEVASAHYVPLPKDYQQRIKDVMIRGWKDPYSVVYRFEGVRHGYIQDPPLPSGRKVFGLVVTVYINAKNSFGGFIGEEPYLFIYVNGQFLPFGDALGSGLGGYV